MYAQPALFLAGLAAVEKLRAENPSLADSASACAGLSLGEYSALVFAGVLSLEDGLKVVKVRAESMAAAAKQGEHGMLSVVGVADPDLEQMCSDAVAECGPGCVVEACGADLRPASHFASLSPPTFVVAARCAVSPTSCSRRAVSCRATRPRSKPS